jgi:uracil-DNA glycosylase
MQLQNWNNIISSEINKPYFKELMNFLNETNKETLCPEINNVFNAYKLTQPEDVKCVIIGQDPYHTITNNKRVAHGLSFSSLATKRPPSLLNVYKEILNDIYNIPKINKNNFEVDYKKEKMNYDNLLNSHFKNNDLTQWAKQGVFLLNTILTVEQSKPLSHQNKGWEQFTGFTLKYLLTSKQPISFLIWGGKAKKLIKDLKKNCDYNDKHLFLEAGHPSPLSIRHFENCNHFSKTNNFLKKHYNTEINWEIS